ncbi:outer membrane protein [Legionella sp. km772]|uniref:outer membrane protein n=1 Tax=Legionella sp. km772 TaxID=2498111 RepID=UPI000F8EB13B|nr:outer membrane beta-barrel protein [Legionella sp. km772]RUR08848.1 porin family protein [Legionella sp. km772]
MKTDFFNKLVVSTGFLISTSCLYAGGMGPVHSVHNWTGFYIGGNAGYLWGSYSAPVWIETLLVGNSVIGPSIQSYNEDVSSFTAGGQIGYNYQTHSNWLFGAEFSFNGERLDAIHYVTAAELSSTTAYVVDDSYAATNNWHSAVLARLGYAWNNFMFYGVGGVALANINFAANFIESSSGGVVYPAAYGNDNEVMVGGTGGLGLAYALSPNLNIGVEARYTNYGSQKFNLATVPIYPAAGLINNFYYQPAYAKLSVSTGEAVVKVNYQFT